MTFLAVMIVYLMLHQWRNISAIQHDAWFSNLINALRKVDVLAKTEGAVMATSIAIPLLIVVAATMVLQSIWVGLVLLVAVPVLLYSVGRGRFKAIIISYLQALKDGNWSAAVEAAKSMDCNQEITFKASSKQVSEKDWKNLHHQFLYAASYRGFERVFAVFFWFVVLGPIGALLYRLSSLYLHIESEKNPGSVNSKDKVLAQRWLWLLEWPAARALGISYAVTGNFMGCIRCWRSNLFDAHVATQHMLGNCVKGALTIDEDDAILNQVEERQLRWLQSLLSRTLIFWMSLLAVFTIVA